MRARREATPPAIPPMGTLLLLEPPEIVGGTKIAAPVMVAVDVMPSAKIDSVSVVNIEVIIVERVWTGDPPSGSDVGVTVIVVVIAGATLYGGDSGGESEVLGCGWVTWVVVGRGCEGVDDVLDVVDVVFDVLGVVVDVFLGVVFDVVLGVVVVDVFLGVVVDVVLGIVVDVFLGVVVDVVFGVVVDVVFGVVVDVVLGIVVDVVLGVVVDVVLGVIVDVVLGVVVVVVVAVFGVVVDVGFDWTVDVGSGRTVVGGIVEGGVEIGGAIDEIGVFNNLK